MQKQKVFALFSFVLVAVLLVTLGSTASASSRYQATAEATMSATEGAMAAIPGTGLVKAGFDGEAKALTGSGATFPKPLYDEWVKQYKAAAGVEVNYKGGGSSQGRKDIIAQAVDFAGSDSPMSDDEVKQANAKGGDIVHVPTTLGAIVPIYNIPELKGKDALKFSGDVLAQIYLGKITKWNDAALVADNPALADIDQDIITVFRSDGSGTTSNFTTFLKQSNKEWADNVKSGSTVEWPTQKTNPPTGRGAAQNAGVHDEVVSTDYAIGYVDQAFAKDIDYGMVKNQAGQFVKASPDSVSKAAEGIDFPADLRKQVVGLSKDPGAYPITAMTWIVVYTKQTDAKIGNAVARFLWWATHDGQAFAPALTYAPLPESVIKLAEANIMKITVDGKPALGDEFAKVAAEGAMMEGTMAPTMAATK